MLDRRKVEEEFRTLFREIHGDPDLDVVDAEDIAPGWEARIFGFRLVKGDDSTEMGRGSITAKASRRRQSASST